MKPVPVILTAAGLSLCLAACGSSQNNTAASSGATSSPTASSTASSVAAATAAGTTAAESAPVATADATEAAASASQSAQAALAKGDMDADLLAPTAIDKQVDLGQAAIAIKGIKAIDGEAHLPGEVAGPAVAITVSVTNNTSKSLPLSGMVVDLQSSDGAPYTQLSTGSTPPPASVAPGGTKTGTWVFTIPVAERKTARILVDLGADTKTAVLQGDLSSM